MTQDIIKIPVNKLIDIFLEVGIVPNAKFHYHWDEYSEWQINMLINLGMKPSHKLLDVGCGPLRFGIQAINYLDDGNYYGMDASPEYTQVAPLVAKEAGLTKKYNFIMNTQFEFGLFNSKFDFANAQSVFTHLSKAQILKCMREMKKVMNPGGIFAFTNITSGYSRGFLYAGEIPMIAGTDCSPEFYKQIAAELNIDFIENTNITHPTQTVYIFKF